jgi:hypothetical protein
MSVINGTENFTNGAYEIPDDKETGAPVFDKLEEFMERMATHTHSGADSNTITLNIAKGVQSLQAGVDFSWNPVSPGRYRALVDVIAGSTFEDNVRTYYYQIGSGEPREFYPTVEKHPTVTTQYYLYSNVNVIDGENVNLKVVTI